jgi:hypothetical protein
MLDSFQSRIIVILLLTISNSFMTFAWYSHLKVLPNTNIALVILISWLIAFLEYIFLIPATRIGITVFNIFQIKIIQEVITFAVFIPFAIFYLKESFRLNYLYAIICLFGAIYFIFK